MHIRRCKESPSQCWKSSLGPAVILASTCILSLSFIPSHFLIRQNHINDVHCLGARICEATVFATV